MLKALGNLFQVFVNAINDLARALTGGRSTDALVNETVESLHDNFGRSYEAAKSAGGQIEITEDMLANAQSSANTARLNAERAVKAATKMTAGSPELAIQNQKIVRMKQMEQQTTKVAEGMAAAIVRAKQLQLFTEGKVAVGAIDMQLRETVARTNAAMETLYGTLESVTDGQLRAAGYLQDQKVADHSAEISRRAKKAEGRYKASSRVAEQILGSQSSTELSADEEEILAEAYRSAGAKMPVAEQTPTEKSAS